MSDTQAIQDKKWVIVFLIYSDFRVNREFPINIDFRKEIDCLLGDILNVPIDKNKCRLYVILNSIKYLFKDEEFSVEDNTVLYKIDNPNGYGKNRIADCKLIKNDTSGYNINQETGSYTLQNPQNLKKIFTQLELKKKEEELFLITWDHGSAFGIFRESVFTAADVASAKPADADFSSYQYLKEFWDAVTSKIEYKKLKEKIAALPPDAIKSYYIYKRKHKFYKFDKQEYDKAVAINTVINAGLADTFFNIIKENNSLTLFLKDKAGALLQENALTQLPPEKIDLLRTNLPGPDEISPIHLNGDNVTEILKNDELAEALSAWLGPRVKVGVLLMMNCWLMNLHTMYSLRNVVQCLVAPQSDIGVPGYNCRDILFYFQNNSLDKITSQSLAAECVKTCENNFAKKRFTELKLEKKFPIEAWKVFAMDLGAKRTDGHSLLDIHLILLKKVTEAFIKSIRYKNINEHKIELRYAFKSLRRVAFDFSRDEECYLIDIKNFLLSLNFISKDFLFDPVLEDSIDALINADIQNLILKQSFGSLVYDETKGAITVNAPSGFSIFFPDELPTNSNLIDNFKTDQLITVFLRKWLVLLSKVFDITF
jgi:hypothetical protein